MDLVLIIIQAQAIIISVGIITHTIQMETDVLTMDHQAAVIVQVLDIMIVQVLLLVLLVELLQVLLLVVLLVLLF
jgi:hypothetical protein